LDITLLNITVVVVVAQVVFLPELRQLQTLFLQLCPAEQVVVDDTTKDLETLDVRAVGLQAAVQAAATQTVL
jgi:hypothetical protein